MPLNQFDQFDGDPRMSEIKQTTVEVRLPSRMGFEKVAMSTASAVAKLMGFPEDRGGRGMYQRH